MPDDHSHASELFAASQAADAPRVRYPVEAAFTPPGPYATTTSTVTDGAGNAIYDIYFPADYGALGFQSPIVTWGNGTAAIPPEYTALLTQAYQLRGDPTAAAAFTGANPELLANTNWPGSAVK